MGSMRRTATSVSHSQNQHGVDIYLKRNISMSVLLSSEEYSLMFSHHEIEEFNVEG